MRLHGLLGERRLSWIRRRRHRKLRRPEFPGTDNRGVGGVTASLGLFAARHSTEASGKARMISSRIREGPGMREVHQYPKTLVRADVSVRQAQFCCKTKSADRARPSDVNLTLMDLRRLHVYRGGASSYVRGVLKDHSSANALPSLIEQLCPEIVMAPCAS
jgi:hypothetical protein